MIGKWTGSYWFSGDVPAALQGRKTDFALTVEKYVGTKIFGKVSDNVAMGGTKGVGTFSGTVKGNNIKFVKRMPIRSFFLPDGTMIEEDKPHRPIHYRGKIDPKTGTVKGTWKFKIGLGFAQGRLVLYPGTSGAWEMKKTYA